MATQAERRAATRKKILDSARRLFIEDGYEATTIGAVLGEAGVSRGALYHHFSSKEALAEALFETTSRDAIDRGSRAVTPGLTATETLIGGCLGWLDQACRADVAAILFDLGPTAIGWARCREIENAHSLRVLRHSIDRAVAADELSPPSVELAAITLNAVLAELALALVHDPGTSRTDVDEVVRATVHAFCGLAGPHRES